MGSLALAGAIGGVGKGMQSNVEHSRVMEREDLEREHARQLEAQRAQSNRDLQKDQQGFISGQTELGFAHDEAMANTRYERDLSLAEGGWSHETNLAEMGAASQEAMNTQDNQTSFLNNLMNNYFSQSGSTKVSADGWKVSKSTTDPTPAPDGTWIPGETIFDITDSKGNIWIPRDGKLFRPGGKQTPTYDLDIASRRAAEKPLYDGEITPQVFEDTHGYVPQDYVVSKAANSVDVSSWMKQSGIAMPDWLMQKGKTGAAKTGLLKHGGNLEREANVVVESPTDTSAVSTALPPPTNRPPPNAQRPASTAPTAPVNPANTPKIIPGEIDPYSLQKLRERGLEPGSSPYPEGVNKIPFVRHLLKD